MPKKNTPTFIHQFALKTQPWQAHKLLKRMNALRDLYNAVLGEAFNRLNKLRKDPDHQECIKDYKIVRNEVKTLTTQLNALITKKANKTKIHEVEKALNGKLNEKQSIIKSLRYLDKKYGFTKYDLQPFATQMKNNSYMKDHLDGDTVQIMSDRVFDTINAYRYGQKGRPRFKPKSKALRSIQGKSNTCIRFTKQGQFAWNGLTLDVVYDKKDTWHVQQHALNSKVKYVRLIHRQHKGKDRFYMQLALEGEPMIKANYNVKQDKKVGIDIGVSTIAAVSRDEALLQPFVLELNNMAIEIKRLQRKASRKLRLLNPDNYNEHGAVIKGRKDWIKSNHYIKLQQAIKALHATLAAKRYHLHYQLVKDILSMGNVLHIEKNNYKAWQKGLYGKTLGFRAPSQFQTLLVRKALQTGGTIHWIDARQAKLSQYDHVSNDYIKKSLDQRIHCLGGNTALLVQRDLYSAALAWSYDFEKNEVDRTILEQEWTSLDMGFKCALSKLHVQYHNSQKQGLYPSCLRTRELLELERIAHESLIETRQYSEQSIHQESLVS